MISIWRRNVEPEVGDRRQRLVEVAQRVGARDRPSGAGAGRRIIHGWRSKLARVALGDRGQRRAPAASQLGLVDELAADDRVAHEVEQLVLAAHVVVEAHRPEPELGGDAPHRHRVEPSASATAIGGLGDVVARAGRAPSARLGPGPDRLVQLGSPACRGRGAARVALCALDISYSVLLPYAVRTTVHRTNEELHDNSPRRRHLRRRARQALRRPLGAARRRPRRPRRARCSACSATTAPARPPPCASSPRCCSPTEGRARVAGHDVVADAADGAHADRPRRPAGHRRRAAHRRARTSRWSAASTTCRAPWPARAPTSCSSASSLADAADRLVRTFSGGMRRRLDLAASLVAAPPVLFLDEPTTGLDPRSRIELWDLLRELVRDGATLLLTTQYLEEADRLADDIVVLDGGRVVAQGSPGRAQGPRRRRAARGHRRRRRASSRRGRGGSERVRQRRARRRRRRRRASSRRSPPACALAEVVRALDAAGVATTDLHRREATLDDVFLALTEPRRDDRGGRRLMTALAAHLRFGADATASSLARRNLVPRPPDPREAHRRHASSR